MNALPYSRFHFSSLNEIRPAGWLQDFLHRQSTGLTGNVAVSGYPYGYKFWGSKADQIQGSYSTWWPYEQTAYWIDGALKCGFLAGENALYQQALDEIDFAIRYADPDGFIGPEILRNKDRWPHAVFFRAVIAQYEITGDRRYLDALIRHYRALPHPMDWSRDVTGVEILLYLYQETGESDMLALAEDLYNRYNQKFPTLDAAIPTLLSEKMPTEHGVTFNEEAKLAAMLYCATGNETYLRAVVHGYDKLDQKALLADGLHSCSEHIRGKTSRDMHETCDLTDHTWALAYLLQATGAARYADRIEQVIYNALPGSITKDFHALQYFSCPNQVIATNNSNHNLFMRTLNWMSFRPDHEVQCCPGNLHRAMPNFISRMWMRTPEGGIVAALYGPGSLKTSVGTAQTVATITARTRYPYEQVIEFAIDPAVPVSFPFVLRIPAWCKRAALSIDGQPIAESLHPGTFFSLERRWKPGSVVRLELPYEFTLNHFPQGGVSLQYGPLTLALPIAARAEKETENSTTRQRQNTLGAAYQPRPLVVKPEFPAWNLFPASDWNYALCLDEESLKELTVEWNSTCEDPLDAANPVLKVRVPARRVRGWRIVHLRRARSFGHWIENGKFQRGIRTVEGNFQFTPPLPDPDRLPARLEKETREIELIPYAATLLRVTVFPQATPR
ncbi:MAG TPA: beta-L-arabinofuranosidase domain-containing protein [Anaerolineaceae bacterium]